MYLFHDTFLRFSKNLKRMTSNGLFHFKSKFRISFKFLSMNTFAPKYHRITHINVAKLQIIFSPKNWWDLLFESFTDLSLNSTQKSVNVWTKICSFYSCKNWLVWVDIAILDLNYILSSVQRMHAHSNKKQHKSLSFVSQARA